MPLRAALDATYALDPEPTGVARYSRRIISALADAGVDLTLAARPRRFTALLRQYPGSRFRCCCLQEPFNLLLPRGVQLFHGLNQRLPGYQFNRQITTIHDVFALSSDRYSSRDFRAKFGALIRDAVERSDALIAVSAYTRDQLCLHTGADPARVTVVHHGVDPAHGPRVAAAEPYLLNVGVVQVRKNTLAAVRVIERLPAAVHLVIAGGQGYGAEETLDYIRRAGLSDRVRLAGHCSEAELDALYRGARALLFPSLEEGFGFPVLEAMVRGLPVVAARAASIPEVAGDAALLSDPDDIDGMTAACSQVLDDPVLEAELAHRGRMQAAKFTWPRAGEETIGVYQNTLA